MAEPWQALPVFITCRDRVSDLRTLVDWLLAAGMSSITLLDNASSYPPLLQYYSFLQLQIGESVRVHRLGQNLGHLALFTAGLAPEGPFILSDPDLVPLGPPAGLQRLWDLFTRYPERSKVGFGLELEGASMPFAVFRHEISFWAPELALEPGVYDAPIDTTFAIWRDRSVSGVGNSLRTGRPDVMRHSSYFTDYSRPELLSEEERYYLEHANASSGWKADLQRYGS